MTPIPPDTEHVVHFGSSSVAEDNVGVRIQRFDFIVSTSMSRSVARTTPRERVRTFTNIVVVIVFVLAILTPAYGYLFRAPPPSDENRNLVPFPDLSFKKHVLQSFPKWFELHFDDHLGYRDVWLDGYRYVMNRVFGLSSSTKAWLGEDGWIYLNVDDPDRHDVSKPSVETRVSGWADVLAARQEHLARRGIVYVVLVVPEKSTVYPEHLPPGRRRSPPPEPSFELSRQLKERGVRHVAVLPHLLEAKQHTPESLYFHTDSHWGPAGAHVAYRALADELMKALPDFRPLPESGYEVCDDRILGDLCSFVGPGKLATLEPCRRCRARDRMTQVEAASFAKLLPESERPAHLPPRTCITPTASGPSLLLLRDSYSDEMLPWYTADFQRVSLVATHRLPLAVIDAEKPRVVVQQVVGRFLYMEKPMNPPEVACFKFNSMN